jgi:hypothetical protein
MLTEFRELMLRPMVLIYAKYLVCVCVYIYTVELGYNVIKGT